MEHALLFNRNATVKPLIKFWNNCVGAGRANEGLRANWQEQLKLAVEYCGFKYIRFHGLLHDDMFVLRKNDGKTVYNFQYIDELFDRLLGLGIRPFVELGFCPAAIASGTGTQFWWQGNVTPPKDYNEWGDLVSALARHWIERYGLDEVKKWYFEVWNEADLWGFWNATKAEYFELYRVSVKAIKAVSSDLRVGGPATSNFVPDERFDGEKEDTSKQLTFKAEDINKLDWKGVWIADFCTFCEKNKLPVDFFSTHPYPTDFALDGHGKTLGLSRTVNSTRQDLQWIRDFVDRSSFKNAEIHLTEWSSSPSPRDCSHDYLPEAAFIVKTNIDSTGLVDSLSYWTFTDVFEEGGAGDSIYHGGFGMINFQGIVKPSFHAYRVLQSLGEGEITRNDTAIATRDEKTGKVVLLAWNYPEETTPQAIPMSSYPDRSIAEAAQNSGEAKTLSIRGEGFGAGAEFLLEILDKEHGNAIEAWKKMGCPEPPTREQTRELGAASWNTVKRSVHAGKDGVLQLDLVVQPWNLVLVKEV